VPDKVILRNFQSAGDIVMLTAAVRDLHRCYPGRYLTDVRTSCSDLWIGNPWLTPLDESDPAVRVIDCHYPIIHKSNSAPYHFLFGFIEYLNDELGLRIQPTDYRGDIHLTAEEKTWFDRVEEAKGAARPFWLFASGGKWDYTIKWWASSRYQEVVDHFRGRIDFVQVGESHHHHPDIDGAIDLRGKTSLRQLVRLTHHAQGVISAVSLLMHLAAAVPAKAGMAKNRPCIVLAGGREPPHFTAYPHHQFIHTVGALRCCDNGGCWKSRTLPLGDGDAKDEPSQLCVDVVGTLPRCMHMITSDEVIRRIEMYFHGGALSYLPAAPAPIRPVRGPRLSRLTNVNPSKGELHELR
jgi:ADP-heptose:LPS heptosyltransferase